MEGPVGPSTLLLHIHSGNTTHDETQSVQIHEAHYRTGVLTVPPKFVTPGPEELKEIAADSELKTRAFATSADRPLWSGDFRAPVRAEATDDRVDTRGNR